MALALVVLVVGSAGATRYYDLRQTPAAIRNACRLVNRAYDDANKPAQQQNERNPVSSIAVASQFWTARDQAMLDDAARFTADYQRVPLKWQNVAIMINSADDQMTKSPDQWASGDPLMLAQAACVGR